MDGIDLKNLKMVFKLIKNSQSEWHPNGINGCSKEEFVKNNPLADISIFEKLDFNKDGYIAQNEYNIAQGVAGENQILTDKKLQESCMTQLKFFARRNIDKWFRIDKNRDGEASNVETKLWDTINTNGKTLDGSLSNAELAQKYKMKEMPSNQMSSLKDWLNGNTEALRDEAKRMFGIELTEYQMIQLKQEAVDQLNTWLLKTGDNENSSFYEQLNLDAYTRLLSTEDGVACCGGDICEIPEFSPSNLEKNGKYTSEEIKARLNWAENSYKVDENGNTILDKNGNTIPTKMMTPKQVQMYKDIVESVTGKPWDSDNWEVNYKDWHIICQKINGTYGDETRLKGKTRADIPENRQNLLHFLEEQNWLYEQFK